MALRGLNPILKIVNMDLGHLKGKVCLWIRRPALIADVLGLEDEPEPEPEAPHDWLRLD